MVICASEEGLSRPAPRLGVRTTVRIPLGSSTGRTIDADMISFAGLRDPIEHFAVRIGDPSTVCPIVRVHSECVTGDVFSSARCDCGFQLKEAIEKLSRIGGYILYLRQEGRGIGLYGKLDAYAIQDLGHDTYSANRLLGYHDDERDYGVAAEMLKALGIDQIHLLSNNPDKVSQLRNYGISVDKILPTGVFAVPQNRAYLEAKVRRANHTIDLEAAEGRSG